MISSSDPQIYHSPGLAWTGLLGVLSSISFSSCSSTYPLMIRIIPHTGILDLQNMSPPLHPPESMFQDLFEPDPIQVIVWHLSFHLSRYGLI
ncbi:hypothetical protein LY76DRAFT_308919 [Colletotrichum caudatum]|nr:hypothetical protein LY76DRAFT_308919 [Colletotrichum caudatum]